MKRLAVLVVIFGIALNAVYAQNIDKTRYKEISLTDYQKTGEIKDRSDTERFKLTLNFLTQIANFVVVTDPEVENNRQRFVHEKKLDFEQGKELVVYVRSTHSPEGGWEAETLDLAEATAR